MHHSIDRIAHNQSWNTVGNEKSLYGSTMRDRSHSPSHFERTVYNSDLSFIYHSLTPNSRCNFRAAVLFNIHSFIQAISRSNQCFTTGVTKAVVCVILSVR